MIKKLTVEVWVDSMIANLKSIGYDSIQSAYDDDYVKAINVCKYLGGSDDYISGMVFENLMCYEFVNNGMQVYNFDSDFTKSILNENWSKQLPKLIKFIPTRSFYLKLPHNATSEGTIIALIPESEIQINALADDFEKIEYFDDIWLCGVDVKSEKWAFAEIHCDSEIYYLCRWAIPSKIEYMIDDTDLGDYPIKLALNAIAYMCSSNADINLEYKPPKTHKANKKKDRKRSFATWYNVGYSIGRELREYERYKSEVPDASNNYAKPHIRRAHWHHYWVGSAESKRLELRWIAPTKVGFGRIESATLHKVK